MKRIAICLLAVMMVVGMVSCEKESGSVGGGIAGSATGKHLVRETLMDTAGRRIETLYTWNKTRLRTITIKDSLTVSFTYDGELVSSVNFAQRNSKSLKYNITYVGDRIRTISCASPEVTETLTLTYEGSNVRTVLRETAVAGYPYPFATMDTLVWVNGNVVNVVNYDFGIMRFYDYDNNPTPYALDMPQVLSIILRRYELLSANNVTAFLTESTHGELYQSWTYTADGYPESCTADGGVTYYLYADGTGQRGPNATH